MVHAPPSPGPTGSRPASVVDPALAARESTPARTTDTPSHAGTTDAPALARTTDAPATPGHDSPRPLDPAPLVAEITTRLGDRTLDVRHLSVTADPPIPPAAWTALGGCAIALGLGIALASLPSAAPAPIDELAAPGLTADAEPPAPVRRGPGLGLGALLILLGVVPVVVGATARSVPRDRYIVGEGPDVHLPFPMPPGSQRAGLPLVRALERQIVLGLFPGLTGELRDGPRTLALADLVAQGRSSYALPPGAECDAILGDLHVHVHAVEPANFVAPRRPLDRLYLASNLGAGALLGVALLLGEPTTTAELELEEATISRDLAVRYLRELPPPPPPPAALPPAPKDRQSPGPSSAPARPPTPPAGPPPPSVDELAVETSAVARTIPKGVRRGRNAEYDFARTAGFLNDPEFIDSVQRAAADAQEGVLSYDNAEDRKMWAAVLAAPVIDRPFGGLELAETERGGGVHRPRAAKAPGKTVQIDMYAKKDPPSAEARALARRIVSIEFEAPHIIGELSSVTVIDHLRRHSGDLSRCFKQAVGTADRVGKIILRLKLKGDGTMSSARVDFSGAQLGDIQPCLVQAARAWKFTPPIDRAPASIAVEASFSARTM